MPDTPVRFEGNFSVTDKFHLYVPNGADASVNGAAGDAIARSTQSDIIGEVLVTEAISGLHRAEVRNGTSIILSGWIDIKNDTTVQWVSSSREQAIGDVTAQAIATATRDAILDRVLAGNHDTAGTAGKLLQTAGGGPTVAPYVRIHTHYDPQGNKQQFTIWIEDGVQLSDLVSDVSVKCDVTVQEFGAGTAHFSILNQDKTKVVNKRFELEQAAPNLTSGKSYEVLAVITYQGKTYEGAVQYSFWGPS